MNIIFKIDTWQEIYYSLKNNKLRTFLTMIGVHGEENEKKQEVGHQREADDHGQSDEKLSGFEVFEHTG